MLAVNYPCNFCGTPLHHVFCDLGTSPISNAFVRPEDAQSAELTYPLRVYACHACNLVQLPEHKAANEIFAEDYVYFSSMSQSWLDHSYRYCRQMTARLGLDSGSLVVEVASNDGYLLQYFDECAIPVLGIEPSASVAEAARAKGVDTIVRFFGVALAEELAATDQQADLLLGNNVLAHVPDINDFVAGLRIALKPTGTITMEFPHLLRLIDGVQFDTIYHEHFSYLSLIAVQAIFNRHGLSIVDVDILPTHGGSLRIFARHAAEGMVASPAVEALLEQERGAGLADVARISGFEERVREAKRALLTFLIDAKRRGKRIAAYGAAAKGNTLLNYCGVRTDFIDFVADRAPSKQGRFLPGTRIPVLGPEAIDQHKPDYVLILPWNLREEIVANLASIRDWGGACVIPLPTVEVIA